jgi:hypothetical protein
VKIGDHVSDGSLEVVVHGHPESLEFKDRVNGRVLARVCGACGHVELRAANPEELYEKYLESKGGGRS